MPGRPFWAAFTAFASNMVALFSADKLRLTAIDVQVGNWWGAVLISGLVACAVYGKEKVSEMRADSPKA
jgi:hypothetical protein